MDFVNKLFNGKGYIEGINENLDESSSTAYFAMQKGMPIYKENQIIKSADREPIKITSLSIPIKSGRTVSGAIAYGVGMAEDDADILELRHIESRLQMQDKQANDSENMDWPLSERVSDYERNIIFVSLNCL